MSHLDVRKPRKAKLDSISTETLILMVRDWLFKNDDVTHGTYLTMVLRAAAKRNNPEAKWLLSVLRKPATNGSKKARWLLGAHNSGIRIPEQYFMTGFRAVWLAKILRKCQDCSQPILLQYYLGRALTYDDSSSIMGIDLLRQAAKSGFTPAMAELGSGLSQISYDETADWLQKAVDLNDPDALYYATIHNNLKQVDWWREAANRGQLNSMFSLGLLSAGLISTLETVKFSARYICLKSSSYRIIQDIELAFKRVRFSEMSGEDIKMLFVAGRELQGYEEFWNTGLQLPKRLTKCIDLYLNLCHVVRLAAIHTVLASYHGGFPRDIAKLLGQYVYRTRHDVPVWYANIKMDLI